MDIACPNCGELWDTYHLRHDEPHEWDVDPWAIEALLERGRFSGPDDPALEAARAAGWVYETNSLLSFTRCPCCPKEEPGPLHARVAETRKERVRVAALVLDDDDALAVELADY